MSTQLDKVLSNFRAIRDPLQQNVFLCDLLDRNGWCPLQSCESLDPCGLTPILPLETLYYRLVIDNIEEMAPIIYTPTVGKVCQRFGSVFRRTRGMYFCHEDLTLTLT